jgi:tRNA(fMet)-specific endonuclease VapC
VKYLLDTNTAVNIMRKPRGVAAERFLAATAADLGVSIVTKAELLVGPNRAKALAGELSKVKQFLSKVRTFALDDACAEEFGRVAAHLFDIGKPVDGMDIEIASTAKVHGLIVVTANLSGFAQIPNIQVENWIQ